jgi:small subunit ribosomal protein S16
MAVKLRLTRVGSKKNPIYRVVAADSRSPRDGKFLEIVGRYNPQTDPSTIDLDAAKVKDRQGRAAHRGGREADQDPGHREIAGGR